MLVDLLACEHLVGAVASSASISELERGTLKDDSMPLQCQDWLEGIAAKQRWKIQVVLLLTKGRNEPFISESLFISPHTMRSHISHIYTKMDIHSRQELLSKVEVHFKKL